MLFVRVFKIEILKISGSALAAEIWGQSENSVASNKPMHTVLLI